jgi:hypothetical protein
MSTSILDMHRKLYNYITKTPSQLKDEIKDAFIRLKCYRQELNDEIEHIRNNTAEVIKEKHLKQKEQVL